MNYKLVIFDMDGTLIDSEYAIAQAKCESMAEHGISPVPDDLLPFSGQSDSDSMRGVAKKYGLEYDDSMKYRAYEIYMANPDRISVFPWSPAAIRAAEASGAAVAIASASDGIKVRYNLSLIGAEESEFAVITSANDVTKQKPDPEIFLFAAEKAGIAPEDCLVCEDTPAGVRAGKAAGMTVAAVTTGHSAEALKLAGADMIVDDLRKVFCGPTEK